MAASETAQRARHWLYEVALPLWAAKGRDRRDACFVEAMDMAGNPLPDLPRRFRVQARQFYTFAHAAVLTDHHVFIEAAHAGFATLAHGPYWHRDGGYMFSAGPDGTIADERRSTYEQAFSILALAWYYRLTRSREALLCINQVLDFLDNTLADPAHGGFREGVPDETPRRQNPHMHLLEAFLALYWATHDGRALDRATAIMELFSEHFLDSRRHQLFEYFTDDWQRAKGDPGQILEPGHHLEWIWLIDQYERGAGRSGISLEAIYRAVASHGLEAGTGFAFDEIAPDGTVRRATKRLWPQTEALKAMVTLYRRGSQAVTRDQIEAFVEHLFEHYLDEERGTWRDQLDTDQNNIAPNAPASSLYHVFVALVTYLEFAGAH